MKLHKIELKNFRGFAEFETDFHPRATVLIGDNATGKTAVLEGVAVAVGAFFLGLPDQDTRTIREDEIRLKLVEREESIPTLEPQYPVRVEAKGVVGGKEVQWHRDLGSRKGRTTRRGAAQLRDVAEDMFASMRASGPDLPMVAFYGTGRLWVEKRQSQRKEGGLSDRLNAYTDCLDPASNHKLLESWMHWLEQVRLQSWADAAEATGEVPQSPPEVTVLEAVEQAVISAVPGAQRFRYRIKFEELRFTFEDGKVLPFRLLSDGFRNFVGMVADIAWRCAQLNPHLGRDAAVATPGVVLVDEIDLHLHPSWQRAALRRLTDTFPEIQFIVTTHSPQVISSARREWMRRLTPDAASTDQVGYVERSTQAILEDVMGVPADPHYEAIRQIAVLIDTGDIARAEERVDALAEKRGEKDDAIVAARWEIQMARGLEHEAD